MEAPLVPQEAIMYRAPEIGLLRNTWEAHRKADVWALGVILMEIAGGWKTVQEIDSEVSVRTERIINLVDKIKILQTNYIKRNGKRKNFKLPAKILLSDRILREELGRDFGKDMSDETSLENQMLCSVFYAKQLCSPEILKRACEDSLEHFHVRKDTGDQELIRSLYETILPRIFVTDVEKRISLQELYTVLSELLSKNTIPTPEPFTGIAEGGIWERIPDKIWRETVLEFHSCTSGCEISYGRKTIPIPINHLLFSKRISEAALEKLIAGVDDILSKDVSSRRKFYENVLTASSFIASELLDFILPYDQCTWFERHTLEDTAPFIKLVGDLLMGEIGQLLPNTGEMDCLTGTSSL
jgi:serine/threonine protein kinase